MITVFLYLLPIAEWLQLKKGQSLDWPFLHPF